MQKIMFGFLVQSIIEIPCLFNTRICFSCHLTYDDKTLKNIRGYGGIRYLALADH